MFLDINSSSEKDLDAAFKNIETFLKKPKNYSPIVMYNQKEK